MTERSIQRQKQLRRRLMKRSNDRSQPPKNETQILRNKRTRRFRKRRQSLKASQLTQHERLVSSPHRGKRVPARPRAVMGKTQRKQVRKPLSRSQSTQRGQHPVPPQRSTPRRKLNSTAPVPRVSRRGRKQSKHNNTLQLFRLMTAGVGIALVSGFVITLMHPTPLRKSAEKSESLQFQSSTPEPETVVAPPPPLFEQPGKELRQLKQEVRNLASAQEPDLSTGLFFLNPETQEFVSHQGNHVFPAASMIKLPILIAFFQDVDADRIQLDEKLTMRPDLVAGEAGAMQYDEIGSQYDALQTADWMITISDNTATNMIIDRIGGPDILNQRFEEWGLEHTRINQPLPDLAGTNTMSPKDLAILMAKVSQGELLSAHSRDRALEILRHTVTKTLLPQGIGSSAQIAHKTGDIGIAVGDAGLIDMPNGQRYVAGIVVKRPHNDPRAQELIRRISKLAYKVFSERPVPRAKPVSESQAPGPMTQPQ